MKDMERLYSRIRRERVLLLCDVVVSLNIPLPYLDTRRGVRRPAGRDLISTEACVMLVYARFE